jgi:membrane protease YdiL (CAAX protease family)
MKMSLLAFYSFSAFGAVGGVATAFLMRSIFENGTSRDIIPSVISWSFSFGIAAVASDAVGEILQTFLPSFMAWSIAFGTLALILGSGSSYAIMAFLRAGPRRQLLFEGTQRSRNATSREKKHEFFILGLMTLPFYLNDFANIYVKDWRLWVWIDYTFAKALPLIVVFRMIRGKVIKPPDLGLTTQPAKSFISVFLIATLAGAFLDQNGYAILKNVPAYPPLGGIPEISSPHWKWFDLTVGLMLVGVTEELVFRGYLLRFLTAYSRNSSVLIMISALAFGLIHWSGGLHQVLVTSAIGGVFMALFMRTRSLSAIMLAHFAVNLIDFAEVIPKFLFKFL